MSSQKVNIIIELEQKLYIKEEKYSWILENPKIILTKMKSLNTLIVIYMDTWQRIAESLKRNKK